ncbi:MAG: hypothetical protein RI957_487 [Verrucomicrobiota bacterium]
MVLLAFATMVLSHADKAPSVECSKLISSIKAEVSANQSFVLQIVERAVRENPSCACEIVKTAIQSTNADSKLIASIIEVVALSAPEQLRLSAQCAVAVAPDSLEAVQAVLAKFDPATGNEEQRSAKGGVDKEPVEEEEMPNPLDFPLANRDKTVDTDENGGGNSGDGGSTADGGGNSGDGGGSTADGGGGSSSGGGSSGGGGGGTSGGSGGGSVGFGSNSPGGNSPGGSSGSPLFGSGGQIVISPPKSTKNDKKPKNNPN